MHRARLPLRTKLGFGAGAIAEAAVLIASNSWNLLFYNHVLGLSGKLCGIAITIAMVLDACSDPVVGSLSDRVRSKLGRRHPFLYAAPLPLALAFVAIYLPPTGLSGMGLFVWLTVTTVLQRQAMTLFMVPHLALGAELSDDYRERSVVMSYNAIFQVVGGAATFFFGWTWFGHIEGGSSVRTGYPGMAIGVAAIAAIAILLSAHATRDRIPFLKQPRDDQPAFSLSQLLHEMRACFRNHNFMALLLGVVLMAASVGTHETLLPYSSLFFWRLPEARIRVFGLAGPPAFLLAFALTARLHDWVDKRASLILGLVLVALASGLPVPLALAGWMPAPNAPALVPVLLCFVFVFYLGVAVLLITLLSALADVVDEHELQTGLRQEGVFYASRMFSFKLSTGFGHVVAGFAIDLFAFPRGAQPGTVAPEIVTKLALVEGPFGALLALLGVVFYARYRIDRARHREIQRALEQRRTQPNVASEAAQAAPAGPPEIAAG